MYSFTKCLPWHYALLIYSQVPTSTSHSCYEHGTRGVFAEGSGAHFPRMHFVASRHWCIVQFEVQESVALWNYTAVYFPCSLSSLNCKKLDHGCEDRLSVDPCAVCLRGMTTALRTLQR
jgi:hypothetical protein